MTAVMMMMKMTTTKMCDYAQWRRYTRTRQEDPPPWLKRYPGSALPSPAYCFASVIENRK